MRLPTLTRSRPCRALVCCPTTTFFASRRVTLAGIGAHVVVPLHGNAAWESPDNCFFTHMHEEHVHQLGRGPAYAGVGVFGSISIVGYTLPYITGMYV